MLLAFSIYLGNPVFIYPQLLPFVNSSLFFVHTQAVTAVTSCYGLRPQHVTLEWARLDWAKRDGADSKLGEFNTIPSTTSISL
jgi:hypothetical protein